MSIKQPTDLNKPKELIRIAAPFLGAPCQGPQSTTARTDGHNAGGNQLRIEDDAKETTKISEMLAPTKTTPTPR